VGKTRKPVWKRQGYGKKQENEKERAELTEDASRGFVVCTYTHRSNADWIDGESANALRRAINQVQGEQNGD
jgi:hypothetical protein